jgi:hypothetical protein
MPFPNKNPLSELHKVPPFLVHALAINNTGRRRFTLLEIVARSGLSERTYLRTVRNLDWRNVKEDVIERVLAGTGVNPWRFKRHRKFLRKYGETLRFINKRQRDVYLSLANQWIEQRSRSVKGHIEPKS